MAWPTSPRPQSAPTTEKAQSSRSHSTEEASPARRRSAGRGGARRRADILWVAEGVRGYLLRRVGDSVDLEEDVGVEEGSHLHGRARGRMGGIDELVPDIADSWQVLDVCQEHLKLHDLVEGQPNSLQPAPYILE